MKLTGDAVFSFFPETVAPGDCGTFLQLGSEVYSPDFDAHDASAATSTAWTPWTPVSQSGVTGDGTSAEPYTVSTVVAAGATGVELRERLRYVSGEPSYETQWTVVNPTAVALDVRLYRAGDCFLAGTDTGFGAVDPSRAGTSARRIRTTCPPAG